ncbi:hypothetical protein [Thermoanaerobacter sp. YS13]|uniref:hypothetical protein n=1 Tax=Thermoanaerobacter sp. YS13 TaxID=1511746 RepID=UPI001F470A7D|nr:hypothetical protein [Thermoanaerobacter sp. YS13]
MVMDIIEHIKMEAETLDNLEEEEPDFFAVSYLLNFLDILQEKQLLNLPESKELQKKVLKYAGKLAPFVKGRQMVKQPISLPPIHSLHLYLIYSIKTLKILQNFL